MARRAVSPLPSYVTLHRCQLTVKQRCSCVSYNALEGMRMNAYDRVQTHADMLERHVRCDPSASLYFMIEPDSASLPTPRPVCVHRRERKGGAGALSHLLSRGKQTQWPNQTTRE